jgi:hypothetical protein
VRRHAALIRTQVALLGCLCLFTGAGRVSAQAGDGAGTTLGRIVWIEPKEPKGTLKVQQGKKVAPVNAAEGMLVRRGYMLILDPTARAAVVCGDGRKRELAPGRQGCPCTQPCTPEVCGINYGGSTIGPTRGPDTNGGLFPAIISPRQTRLRTLRPTIRWSPIAGATGKTAYTVTLYGERMQVVWTKEVASETRLDYPDREPPLKPGQTYVVAITSGGRSSQEDHSPGLGFTTLTAAQARALADEEARRRQMQLPEPQTRFLIANLYAARELYAEAIEQLEDLYTTMKEPAVVRMLGDLYAVIGLNREAEKKYLEALALTPADDLDGMGATQKDLAQVYESLGIIDRAIARLAAAKRAYQGLRNWAMVNAMSKDEQRLKKLRSRP